MKRKLLILAAALVIAVSAVGCGKDEDKTDAEVSRRNKTQMTEALPILPMRILQR